MAGDYAEWNAAELYYQGFYQMEQAYHFAMARQPPDVVMAFRILRQIYARVHFALDKKTAEDVSSKFDEVRGLIYDSENISFAWAPAVRAQLVENMNASIELLTQIQMTLYKAMNDKKMLLPFGRARSTGYASIGPGGMMD